MNLSNVTAVGGLVVGAFGAVGTLLQELRYRRERRESAAPVIEARLSRYPDQHVALEVVIRNRSDQRLQIDGISISRPRGARLTETHVYEYKKRAVTSFGTPLKSIDWDESVAPAGHRPSETEMMFKGAHQNLVRSVMVIFRKPVSPGSTIKFSVADIALRADSSAIDRTY